MFLHMCNLLYNFLVNFIVLICHLWLLAHMGTPVDFDSLLPDRDLTQKLHNKLNNVRNHNNNVLTKFGKIHPLFTRCTAQLEAGGPVTSELLYCTPFNVAIYPRGDGYLSCVVTFATCDSLVQLPRGTGSNQAKSMNT